jgi:hypothetical protein
MNRELYERAAKFYDQQPTGQYDDEAAHALRCYHELLNAVRFLINNPDNRISKADIYAARDAIIKSNRKTQ